MQNDTTKTPESKPETTPPLPPAPRLRPLRRSGRTAPLLILLALIAMASLWLLAHHVVVADEGLALLRKRYLGTTHTWVDIRTWDHTAFQAAPALTDALKRQGYGDLVKHPPPPEPDERILSDRFREKMQELSQQIEQSYQQAEKATREWALEIINYWKARLEN